VWLDVVWPYADRESNSLERAELVNHQVEGFFRSHRPLATSKVFPIRKAGVRADCHPSGVRRPD
jgi:hypothetical protein